MSKFGIFIIESLRSDDYVDGENLGEILRLAQIDKQYRWADSVEDFERQLLEFKSSGLPSLQGVLNEKEFVEESPRHEGLFVLHR